MPDSEGFYDVVSNLDLHLPEDAMPQVTIEDDRYGLDPFVGAEFVQMLREAHDDVRMRGGYDEKEVVAALVRTLEAKTSPVEPASLLVVNGSGLVVGLDRLLRPEMTGVLNNARNLVGRVAGFAYGRCGYLTAEQIAQLEVEEIGEDAVEWRNTPLIVLADAAISGDGRPEDGIVFSPSAGIPIDATDIQVHRAVLLG